uniref:Uncharacterized protein n=1 Tax=Arundo donax TaxID=35708 RepID=A0A0A9GHE9_ARUDO
MGHNTYTVAHLPLNRSLLYVISAQQFLAISKVHDIHVCMTFFCLYSVFFVSWLLLLLQVLWLQMMGTLY